MRARRLRGPSTVIAAVATLLVAACWAGCEPVPDIRFVSDDARAPGDGRADSADGSSSGDGGGSCVGAAPAPGATCCGSAWCVGECGPDNCQKCVEKGCADPDLCCGNPGTVQCKAKCQ